MARVMASSLFLVVLGGSSCSSKLEDIDGPRRTRNQPGRGRRLGATTAAPPSTSPTARA